MARLFFALLIVSAALIQATILPNLQVIGVLPDLVLVLLLLWSALRGMTEGAVWVFGTGLLLDLLAMDRFGTNGLALFVVALLAGPARRRFFHSGLVFPIALTVVATIAHAMILLLLRSGTGAALPLAAAFRLIVLQAMLNSLIVPPLYLVAGWMDRKVVPAHA
jgi:rod shape-determining protein MreD